MDQQTTAQLIRRLRLEQGLTQSGLAQRIHVSAKAVSKWERAVGLPDASIIPALSHVLGVSSEALLNGQFAANPHDGGNMERIRFYQCPDCGNILTATGNPEISCCARRLAPMKLQPSDDAHQLTITNIEDEKLVQWQHPMDKPHHLTFLAEIGHDSVHIVRLYPEGAQEHRMPRIPWAIFCCGCSEAPGTLFISK
ncbi:MAG: helix-turn-helix domain-containing protein [Clostridia bacterium]|nr:helix-turn-helix domain-containing protein [Clostridia bacterium]